MKYFIVEQAYERATVFRLGDVTGATGLTVVMDDESNADPSSLVH